MVYESDFYTTRRPYTRPISSHYTVTNPGAIIRPITPIQQSQAVNRLPHIIPYVGHKRLVHVIHTPYPVIHYARQVPLPIRIYSRVRPSVIAAELQRIRDLPRPSSISYVSRYLNSRDHILFDDETREIRARADSLLRKIHVFVPRPLSSDFAEVIVPERMRSDDYIRRLLAGRYSAKKYDDESPNWYDTPAHRDFGTGHLAAVSYTGGKPHSRRRPYYKVADLRAADVQSDVNLLSYYAKNRQAAASAYPDPPPTEREIRKARALAEDLIAAAPRRASPDPEPVYKPDLATVYEPPVVKEREPEPEPEVVKEKKVRYAKQKSSKSERIVAPEPEPEPEPELETKIPEPEPEPVQEESAVLELELEPKPTIPEPEPEPEQVQVQEDPIVPEPEEMVAEPEEIASDPRAQSPEPMPDEPVEPETVEPELEEPLIIESSSELPTESEIPEPEPEAAEVPEQVQMIEQTPEEEVPEEDNAEQIEAELPELETEPESEPVEQHEEIEVDDYWGSGDKQDDEEVLQRKLDEEELRRQVEELKRQAEEEKRRQAEEARLAEERWKAEIEERERLEREARAARLREIEEQERAQAERIAEEERLEAERTRDARIAEEQRRAAELEEIIAKEEEERYAIEKASEEAHKRQDIEEKLAEIALSVPDENGAPSSTSEECHCHDNVKSLDHEERPDSPDADDDTHVEEEVGCISTDHDDLSDCHPYDGEHEGFNSIPVLEVPVDHTPKIEEVTDDEDA